MIITHNFSCFNYVSEKRVERTNVTLKMFKESGLNRAEQVLNCGPEGKHLFT